MAFTTPIHELIERNPNGLLGKHPSWERVRLGDVATVQNGAAFKSEYFNTEGRGMPLMRIRDVVRGRTETWYDGPYEDDYIVQPGDLVIGMDGDFNHALWNGPPALLNQRVCRLRFNDAGLSKELVAHLLGGYLQAVNEATPSVTVKHLSSRTVSDLLLPCPSQREQDRMVAVLATLTAEIHAGADSFHAALDGVDQYRAAVLGALDVPDCPRTVLGEIAQVFVGATPSRKDASLWDGGIPWVSSGEVAFCRINSTRETVTEAGLGNRATRLHPPGTVLLAMIGEGKTRGQAAILDVAAAHNQNCASIRMDSQQMLPEYLYYVLMSNYESTRRGGAGSQQPALNGKLVRAIEVPCPPVGAQTELVELVERQLAACEQLEADIRQRLAQSQKLRTAVLRDAALGRLTADRMGATPGSGIPPPGSRKMSMRSRPGGSP